MEGFQPSGFLKKIKKGITLATAGVMIANTAPAQTQSAESQIVNGQSGTEHLSDTTKYKERKPINYLTNDGNLRHFYNPNEGFFSGIGDEIVLYAYGATESPYKTEEEMKEKTRVPESLGETDFFTNYTNSNETDTTLTDPITGNRYSNFREINPTLNSVPYEGGKFWNIQRFLIDPHYKNFDTDKTTARKNALFDIYRYFLYEEKGNRENAWQKANEFIEKEVDPIVNGKAATWLTERGYVVWGDEAPDREHYWASSNLFREDNTTDFAKRTLEYNKDVLDGSKPGRAFTKEEVREFLINYNIEFRKKTKEEAEKIATEVIQSAEEKFKHQIAEAKTKPLQEYKVIQEGSYPEGFDSWDPVIQDDWRNKNPDKVRIVQESYTEKDRERELEFYRNFVFL